MDDMMLDDVSFFQHIECERISRKTKLFPGILLSSRKPQER